MRIIKTTNYALREKANGVVLINGSSRDLDISGNIVAKMEFF